MLHSSMSGFLCAKLHWWGSPMFVCGWYLSVLNAVLPWFSTRSDCAPQLVLTVSGDIFWLLQLGVGGMSLLTSSERTGQSPTTKYQSYHGWGSLLYSIPLCGHTTTDLATHFLEPQLHIQEHWTAQPWLWNPWDHAYHSLIKIKKLQNRRCFTLRMNVRVKMSYCV